MSNLSSTAINVENHSLSVVDADIVGERMDYLIDVLQAYGRKTRLTLKTDQIMAQINLIVAYGGPAKSPDSSDLWTREIVLAKAAVEHLDAAVSRFVPAAYENVDWDETIEY